MLNISRQSCDRSGLSIGLWLNGITGIEPGEKAALKRLDLFETVDQQKMRRTGARFFI